MNIIGSFTVPLALACSAAQGLAASDASPVAEAWRSYGVSDEGCGLQRQTPDFKISMMLLKGEPHIAMTISSETWDLAAFGQYPVRFTAGELNLDGSLMALSPTGLFFELPSDHDFRSAVASSEVLIISGAIQFVAGGSVIRELTLPFDNGDIALRLLAECGLPQSESVPFKN